MPRWRALLAALSIYLTFDAVIFVFRESLHSKSSFEVSAWFSPLSPSRWRASSPSHTHLYQYKDSIKEDVDHPSLAASEEIEEFETETSALTNAILEISYDGSRFTGWSAANDNCEPFDTRNESRLPPPLKRGRGRRRNRGEPFQDIDNSRVGFVRSVQGVLRQHLAKLYGNVAIDRVVVEGCSRTDKGVHARALVAQIYCYKEKLWEPDGNVIVSAGDESMDRHRMLHIRGKHLPHPCNATDISQFIPLPKQLRELKYTLNRMLPQDVRIMRIASTPRILSHSMPFHPSLSATSKTYQYRFSLGLHHDPTYWRTTWHIQQSSRSGKDVKAVLADTQLVAHVLTGRHNFAAFRAAPRSNSDKLKRLTQDTWCTVDSIAVHLLDDSSDRMLPWRQADTFLVTIKGDRFLYKMVRLLVGALVGVGVTENLQVFDIQQCLDTGSRQHLQQLVCAPAHGLVLAEVEYQHGNITIDWQ